MPREDPMKPLKCLLIKWKKKRELQNPPELGFLTISNALQWRLQYSRIIDKAGEVEGILRLR
jgi:hypothetical protein